MRPTASARPPGDSRAGAAPVFLTAEWRDLVMANYEVPQTALLPLVPAGTELDAWNGRNYLSLVGFRFLNTRIWNIAFPFHRNFEEVNLRFYVRRKSGNEWRRGVVFIREIVPRQVIAWAAKTFYNENYIALPMAHRIEHRRENSRLVSYSWKESENESCLSVTAQGKLQPLATGSEADFILEHYWGYSRQRNGSTLEYQVEHSPWRTQPVLNCTVEGEFGNLYGPAFDKVLQNPPSSVFLAEGSAVIVRKGVCLS